MTTLIFIFEDIAIGMVKITSLCTDCVQVITNPLCPYCFSRHVVTWLRDKKLPEYRLKRVKQLLRSLVLEAEETPADTKCIVCGSQRVNLCTYCITNRVTAIIEKNTSRKVVRNFEEDFDTIVWRI